MTKRLAVGLRSARQLPFGLSRSQCVVDAALELAVERDGLVVGEGQDLGQKHPGDSLLRVEPVIGIIYTGPSYAADAAPVWPWLRVDHVPQAPFARNAGEEIDIVRTLRVCRLHDAGIDVADLVLSHQRHRLRPQQPDPVELTLMQQHPQKSEIIGRRRIEAAPAAPEFAPGWVRHRYRLQ